MVPSETRRRKMDPRLHLLQQVFWPFIWDTQTTWTKWGSFEFGFLFVTQSYSYIRPLVIADCFFFKWRHIPSVFPRPVESTVMVLNFNQFHKMLLGKWPWCCDWSTSPAFKSTFVAAWPILLKESTNRYLRGEWLRRKGGQEGRKKRNELKNGEKPILSYFICPVYVDEMLLARLQVSWGKKSYV